MLSSRRLFLTLPAQAPRRLIIDSHQHYVDKPDYIDRLVRNYKPRNAMACVNGFRKDMEAIKKAAAEHPDVVIPYGRINVDEPRARREIDEFAAIGFKGIRLHSPRHNWDDPQYFPLYARIDHHQLPALFHTGIASHTEEPQFTSMERMRPGFLGDPWHEEAGEAARWGPRLYFDLTGSSPLKKAKKLSMFRDIFWWEGPTLHSSPHAVPAFEKLVFGTGEPPENLEVVIGRHEALLNACEVQEPLRKKVYGETLARILKIRPAQ